MADPRATPACESRARRPDVPDTDRGAYTSAFPTHGRRRYVRQGDVLIEAGSFPVPFFVIVSGEVEIVRPTGSGGNDGRRSWRRRVHGRGQPAARPPFADARPRQPERRGDRADARQICSR